MTDDAHRAEPEPLEPAGQPTLLRADEQRNLLPQPGLPLAIGLALLPIIVQFFVGIFLLIVLMAFATLSSRLWSSEVSIDSVAKRAESAMQAIFFPTATLTTIAVALVAAYVMYRRDASRALGWRGFTRWQGLALLLFVLPLAVVTSELTNLFADVCNHFQPPWIEDMQSAQAETFAMFSRQSLLLVFLAGCLFPGVGEEILCRGIMSRGLIARHGLWRGSLLASLLFGAMHLEPIQSVGAFVLGMGLQYTFLTTRSLAAPMVAHTANNTVALLLMRYSEQWPVPGLSPPEDGESVHTPPLLLVYALCTLVAAACLLAQTRTRWVRDDGAEWSPGYVSAERPPAGWGGTPVSVAPQRGLLFATLVLFGLLVASAVISAGS